MAPRVEAVMDGQMDKDEAPGALPRVAARASEFWAALGRQDLPVLESLMEQEGPSLLLLRDPASGKSPLEWAGFLHRHDSMRALLAWGADPEESTQGRPLPLAAAASDHCLECLGLLVEAGADLDAEGPDGGTALFRAANLKLGKHSSKTVSALLDAGAGPDVLTSGGCFALGAAASQGHAASVEALAGAGARLDLHSGDGFTALFYAVDNGELAAAEALLRAGADFRARADCGAGVLDPLGLARERGDASMAALLYSFAEADALRERIAKVAPGAVRQLGRTVARL